MKKTMALVLALAALVCLCACQATAPSAVSQEPAEAPGAAQDAPAELSGSRYVLDLCGDSALLNGQAVEVFDYTWHCDPGISHDEVKDAPAEFYTGTKPETDAAAYIDHELYYYPELPESGFRLVNYDGEPEWAYYYTDGKHEDYIFATLPRLGAGLPAGMMHSEQEAAEQQVLHLTKAGTYILQGEWKGQIRVDLGDPDETFADPAAKVTVVLNGADISCSVAPGILFSSAYEYDNTWETREKQTERINTDAAGVTVVLADGSENTVTGTNVFRMLKTKYKDEESTDEIKLQKKMRKTDAAFYSCVSMQILGEQENTGSLTIHSGFEGLDSELHLTLKGGRITVYSQDDGINVNEDNVSVVCFDGSDVTIHAAQGAEGDGVDSNGFIVLNAGTVSVNGIRTPDSALDSENGIYYYGGTLLIDGEEQDYEPGSVFRETGQMEGPGKFGSEPGPDGWMQQDFDLKAFQEKVAALDENATLEDVLALLGFGGMQQPGDSFIPQAPPAERPDGQMPDGTRNDAPPQKP